MHNSRLKTFSRPQTLDRRLESKYIIGFLSKVYSLGSRVYSPRMLFLSFLFIFLCTTSVWALRSYQIEPSQSKLSGSISYSVVGKYNVEFSDFEGTILFDSQSLQESSVELRVKTQSLVSKYPKLDRIVLSSRLLNARKYPTMHFKSSRIYLYNNIYYVQGALTISGITQELTFPFNIVEDDNFLQANGKWFIKRKDFDILWHKYLDKGGFVVGNTITLDWQVAVRR